MGWILLLLTVALGGCSKNTFEVDDPKVLVRSATLQLCGTSTPLQRAGKSFELSRSITCEGDGEVRLIYQEGDPEHCIVGYVTPDMRQDFHFRAEQSSCRDIAQGIS